MQNEETVATTRQAATLTLGSLLRERARICPQACAIDNGASVVSYRVFNQRVNQLAHALRRRGIAHGSRVALLSENRSEYLELVFACAKLGGIVCALNWRLTAHELSHCIALTTPEMLMVSPRFANVLAGVSHGVAQTIELGEHYEALLAGESAEEVDALVVPEDGLVILYTSGTTGMPKGALISHRAQIARMHVSCADMGLRAGLGFAAWPPLFHMASMDPCISALCLGAKVLIIDGFDIERIIDVLAAERLWWLVLLPGTIGRFCDDFERRGVKAKGLTLVGAMADLVPPHQIARLTSLLSTPYANTFGSTETGFPPASAARIGIGETPTCFSKRQNSLCEVRLVDPQDSETGIGVAGELAIRGPTLFSGYWNAPETNARDFRGGWFHLGDAFVRNADGTLDFVDRVKYMIKSGGENIYPAEIERVLLGDARVTEAVVVKKPDEQWGEVPVAFVACNDTGVTVDSLLARCREQLAGYKQPKAISFVEHERFPRSTTGKVLRHEVEGWL